MHNNRNGIATGALVFIFVALAAILLLRDSGLDMENSMFNSYVDVALQSLDGRTTRYLAITYAEYAKAIDPFTPDEARVLTSGEGAYTQEHPDAKTVVNTLADDRLYDEEGAEVSGHDLARALLRAAADLNAAIRRVRVFEVGDQLFAEITVFVDAWESRSLYHFVKEDTELRHIQSFPEDRVLGLRLTPSSGGVPAEG